MNMEIREIQPKEIGNYCLLQFRAYPSMRFGSKAEWDNFVEKTLQSKKLLKNRSTVSRPYLMEFGL